MKLSPALLVLSIIILALAAPRLKISSTHIPEVPNLDHIIITPRSNAEALDPPGIEAKFSSTNDDVSLLCNPPACKHLLADCVPDIWTCNCTHFFTHWQW